MFSYNFLIILFLVFNHYVHANLEPLVQTNQGLIQGVQATDGNYTMYLGIPYAIINETNPFGASVPHPQFDAIFKAVNDSAVCPQYDNNAQTAVGSIDCLHMNIFVPNSANPQNQLSVLVFVHGGRFQTGRFGKIRFGPKFLVKHDVILVTFNYRVGPYGFLCLDTPQVPGNAGLKDQLIALRWVKENIAAFGGNVNNITLGGQSAGGVSVDFHLLYNKEIYFNQVITMSGTAHCPWAIINSDRNEPIQLAELLGYKTANFEDALSFLSRMNPYWVINAKSRLGTVSRACVEKTFADVEPFITDYPINLRIPRVRTTPVLSGYIEDEMTFEYLNFPMEFFENPNLFSNEISMSFELGDKTHKMGNFFKKFYVGDTMGADSKMKIIDFQSDFRFNHPTQRSFAHYLENGAESVYHYYFTYIGDRNAMRLANNITIGGATHGDEIGYLFDVGNLQGRMTPEDQVMVDRMTTMWTNFVKYGDPTPETTDLLPVKWEPITIESLNYIELNSTLKMGTRPLHSRLTFWDFFYTVNKKFRKGYQERS